MLFDLGYLIVAFLVCNTSATPVLTKRHNHLVAAWESASKSPALAWLHLPELVTKLETKAGLTNVQTPLEIFTVPGYANWTSNGWNLRTHGTAYSIIPFSQRRLDSIAQMFVRKYPRRKWTPEMAKMVRNMTSTLLSKPHKNVQLSYELIQHNGESGLGTLVDKFSIPGATNDHGEFDAWHTFNSPLLHDGVGNREIQTLDEYTGTSELGNATVYLVPEEGITVVADIDDILRDTRIWDPSTGLANSFGIDYKIWSNMPSILNSWTVADPTMHFHYSTTTPQPDARMYLQFVLDYYPPGSFDFRPMNFGTLQQITDPRRVNLIRTMQSFPKRRFILLGDTSNQDAMAGYPAMVAQFPDQIQCIIMRNVSATDSTNAFPYTTKGFKGVNPALYQFIRTSDDLVGIDFAGGGCRNYTFPQNVTFSEAYASWKTVERLIVPSSWNAKISAAKAWFKKTF